MSGFDPRIELDEIIQAARSALSFVDGVGRDEFLLDEEKKAAVAMKLVVIGEAVTKIARKRPDLLETYLPFPWRTVTGMRNRIAHGYYTLDMDVVWQAVINDVPRLLDAAGSMLAALDRLSRDSGLEP